MASEHTDREPVRDAVLGRRALLGFALAAGFLGPMIVLDARSARADDTTDEPPPDEEYEIPDGIGSAPWW